ncbi:MAG TPA: hypothetical protein VF077_09650 [Nitrospiraceae bacterium]
MTAAVQSVELVTFPCEEWVAMRTPEGELVSINPVAGTWTLLGGEDRRRFHQKGMNVKAMFACPRCNKVGFIPEGFKPPVQFGDTQELPELHCRACHFGCRVVLKDWDKRKLYCAAFEVTVNGVMKVEKQYLHAEDEAEAKKFFWAQYSPLKVYLVAIAPVIGFFAKSEKDEKNLVV